MEVVDRLVSEKQTLEAMVKTYRPDLIRQGSDGQDIPPEFPIFYRDLFAFRDFERAELQKFLPRVAAAVVWYYMCVYLNNVSQAWLQQNMAGFYESQWGYSQPNFTAAQTWLKANEPAVYEDRWGNTLPKDTRQPSPKSLQKYYMNQTVTLYDLVFLYLPYVDNSAKADIFAGWSSIVGLVRFVVIPGPMSMRWTFLARVLFVWGVLFLCRAFTILVTPLPNPYHQCVPKSSYPNNAWMAAFANLPGVFWLDELTCQDVMFSGHTAMGTVWTLFTWQYLKRAPWLRATVMHNRVSLLIDALAICWLLFGWYVICASHFHYTVDVFVGALITISVYNVYHNWIFAIQFREEVSTCAELLMKRSIAPVFQWFEQHSVDILHWRSQLEHLMPPQLIAERLIPEPSGSSGLPSRGPSSLLSSRGGEEAHEQVELGSNSGSSRV